jgi:hypothetical protein
MKSQSDVICLSMEVNSAVYKELLRAKGELKFNQASSYSCHLTGSTEMEEQTY